MEDVAQLYASSGVRASTQWFVPFVQEDNDPDRLDKDDRQGIKQCIESLQLLLKLRFDQFVAVLVADQATNEFLETFCWKRSRPWEKRHASVDLEKLDLLVLTCFYRLVFDQEGQSLLEKVETLLVDKGVISAPRLLDLVSLYSRSNHYSKMAAWSRRLLLTSNGLAQNVAKAFSLVDETVWPEILHTIKSQPASNQLFIDRVNYAQDICCTLQALSASVGIVHAAAAFGNSKQDLLFTDLAQYEDLVNILFGDKKVEFDQAKDIRHGRLWKLHVDFAAQFWCQLELIVPEIDRTEAQDEIKKGVVGSVKETTKCLVALLEKVAQDGQLSGVCLADYNAHFDLQGRLQALALRKYATDYVDRLQYLVDIVKSIQPSQQHAKHDVLSAGLSNASLLVVSGNEKGTTSSVGSQSKQVKTVKEVLPELGVYFCQQLLKAVNNDPQRAIQSVLEGNLPKSVRHLDPTLEQPLLLKPVERNDEFTTGDLDEETREKILKMSRKYDQEDYNDDYDDTWDDAGFDVGDGNDELDLLKKWAPGMKDVDGVKRDADGKIIQENEDDLLKPNLNHNVPVQSGKSRRRRKSAPSTTDNNNNNNNSSSSTLASAGKDATKRESNRRKYKDANKARIGNHSRKARAAKKQAKAMGGT